MRAERRRKAFAAVWPIDPSASAAPPGWLGWPEGKQFAFVLTHDVEGQKGFDRIPQLVELSQKYGFRSSFNLVPKGEYQVDRQMLDFLDCSGFEAGVHGLEHDGKLYRSKRKFAAKAIQVHKVLENWGACGFRSPLMQHRLGWIHEFRCEYDASTFDVDPFEPQPDGMSTIFPFWVPGENNSGFVELPYSLVQDFSLFKVLCETNIDIWKKKLDWVAEHGGMALLNTHPDYMCFEGKPARDEYPVAYYEEFLAYAREKYHDAFWHALPREVAHYYCEKLPVGSRNTRRKICMIGYSEYDSDARVRGFAEALARRGDRVDVISLGAPSTAESGTTLNGVTVHQVFRHAGNNAGLWTHALCYFRFLARASSAVRKLHACNRYDVIHIHNVPDFLVFAAWYPKIYGAKLILHIHDAAPEFFEMRFKSLFKRPCVGLLRLIEKLSVKFANHVIISNDLWREKLLARSVDASHCSVMVNHDIKDYPDLIDELSTEYFHDRQPKPDIAPALER
jgi:hypothetical protein